MWLKYLFQLLGLKGRWMRFISGKRPHTHTEALHQSHNVQSVTLDSSRWSWSLLCDSLWVIWFCVVIWHLFTDSFSYTFIFFGGGKQKYVSKICFNTDSGFKNRLTQTLIYWFKHGLTDIHWLSHWFYWVRIYWFKHWSTETGFTDSALADSNTDSLIHELPRH